MTRGFIYITIRQVASTETAPNWEHNTKGVKTMSTRLIDVVIVGYGNVGRQVERAVANASDMRLAAIITGRPEQVKEQTPVPVYDLNSGTIEVVEGHVAVLCYGTTKLKDLAQRFIRQSPIRALVDSFDDHGAVPGYYGNLNALANYHGKTYLTCQGWDPGVFSAMRMLLGSILSHVYTFYGVDGPGSSRGHRDALLDIKGVTDAQSYTNTFQAVLDKAREGQKVGGPTERMFRQNYLVLDEDTEEERARVSEEIKESSYFSGYQVENHFLTPEALERDHSGQPHNGVVIATDGNGSSMEFRITWRNNSEGTAEILVSAARAVRRLYKEERSGAFLPHQVAAGHFSAKTEGSLIAEV